MAKICFYCGKELESGQKCTCTLKNTNASESTKEKTKNNKKQNSTKKSGYNWNAQKKKAKKSYAKAKRSNTSKGAKESFSAIILKIMTNQNVDVNLPLNKKFGYTLLQSFLRPLGAIDSFIYAKDYLLSSIYIFMFSLISGLVGIRVFGANVFIFFESMLFAVSFVLLLNLLVMLAFRFLLKIKYRFINLLCTFSASLTYLSVFFLLSSIGRPSFISFAMTIISGFLAFALLHFLALKRYSGVSNDQLAVNFILTYFIFLSSVGFLMNLILPTII